APPYPPVSLLWEMMIKRLLITSHSQDYSTSPLLESCFLITSACLEAQTLHPETRIFCFSFLFLAHRQKIIHAFGNHVPFSSKKQQTRKRHEQNLA
ncbi:hypothetical protein, partial [uncultured Bacteroides sp.]|uniref:hypothetical protein n=1 Tax=uncultured Bacteroides sp. TaxID=162156 RepID=UPI0025AEF67F